MVDQACPGCDDTPLIDLCNPVQEDWLAELASTNLVPDGPELSTISSLIIERESAVDYLDARILLWEAKLSRLCNKKDTVVEELRTLRRISHPIRRIPRDVLIEIFAIAFQADGGAAMFSRVDPRDGDVVASFDAVPEVSRYWRESALSSPGLWSSFSLTLDSHAISRERLHRQLEWASSALLDVTILRAQNCEMDELTEFLTSENTARWRRLEIHYPSNTSLPFPPFPLTLPSLSSLAIHTNAIPGYHNSADTRDLTMSNNCISLRQAELKLGTVAEVRHYLSLPWAQLSRLSITFESYRMHISPSTVPVVLQAINLAYLYLDLSMLKDNDVLPVSIFPHLKYLHIRGDHRHWITEMSDIQVFLNAMITPSLTTLRIKGYRRMDLDCLNNYCIRSSFYLSLLELDDGGSGRLLGKPLEDSLKMILSLSPTLEVLKLNIATLSEHIFAIFLPDGVDQSAVPRIRRLQLAFKVGEWDFKAALSLLAEVDSVREMAGLLPLKLNLPPWVANGIKGRRRSRLSRR